MTERSESATAIWEAYGAQWIAERPQRLWRRHSDAVNSRLIEQWLPPGRLGKVLKTDLFDEAVSEGVCGRLAPRSDLIIGLDVSPAILSAATREGVDVRAAAADVRTLPLAGSSFDAIVSLSTLDHFDDREDVQSALHELYRVLRPGGVMVLTLDNLANPVIGLRNSIPFSVTHALGLVPYPVGRTFRPADAEKLVTRAGFTVTDRTAIMHAPRVLAVPLMGLLSRNGEGRGSRLLSRAAMAFESLRPLRTKFLTGHFIAFRAVKPA